MDMHLGLCSAVAQQPVRLVPCQQRLLDLTMKDELQPGPQFESLEGNRQMHLNRDSWRQRIHNTGIAEVRNYAYSFGKTVSSSSSMPLTCFFEPDMPKG
jgi:hypothetical protein